MRPTTLFVVASLALTLTALGTAAFAGPRRTAGPPGKAYHPAAPLAIAFQTDRVARASEKAGPRRTIVPHHVRAGR